MNRNYTIDLFRLIAAFFVMVLHVNFRNTSGEVGAWMQLAGRWAVPYFFIASGYFLGLKIDGNRRLEFTRIEKNVANLISILFIASLIYYIHSSLFSYRWCKNEIGFLGTGTYWHLWFVGSLILGYFFIWYMYYQRTQFLLYWISFLILLLAVFSDSYDVVFGLEIDYNEIPRFISSIPFLFIGILFSRKAPRKKGAWIWLFATAAGFVLQIAEMKFLQIKFGYSPYEHQILIGTIFISLAIFRLSISFDIKENPFSLWGRKYSLYIYLYHILVYWFIKRFFWKFFEFGEERIAFFMPVLGFALLMISALMLERYIPWLYNTLNGDFIHVRRKKKMKETHK